MTVEDAANAVAWWLCRQMVTLMPEVFGRETAPEHFRIGVVQVTPEPRKRVFELVPLDSADCYEVKELEQ
jgi:hypothetical protein